MGECTSPRTPSANEYDPWSTDGIPGVREDLVVGKVVNTSLPFIFADNKSLLILLGISVVSGIATIIVFVSSSRGEKQNKRIKELEERIRKLEAALCFRHIT